MVECLMRGRQPTISLLLSIKTWCFQAAISSAVPGRCTRSAIAAASLLQTVLICSAQAHSTQVMLQHNPHVWKDGQQDCKTLQQDMRHQACGCIRL